MGTTPDRLTAKSFYPVEGVKKPSWILILIMCIVFFPVGIYFLHKRVKITKGRGSAAVITFAWSILGAVSMLLCILGEGGIGYWVALAVFIFMWLVALGERVQWKEYDSYIAILMSGEWYLPIIAEAIGKKEKDAISDLKEMFEDGIFAGSYIDMSDMTVETNYSCLNKMGMYAPTLKTIYVKDADPAPSYVKTVIRCMGCGANVEGIVGQTGTCEFCDSPISFV